MKAYVGSGASPGGGAKTPLACTRAVALESVVMDLAMALA